MRTNQREPDPAVAPSRASVESDDLARRFGARSEVARIAIDSLLRAARRPSAPRARACIARWRSGFERAHGAERGGRERTARSLASAYELRPGPFAPLQLAVETYYSLVVKALAAEVVVGAAGGPRAPRPWLASSSARCGLHAALARLEQGEPWRESGIDGFLDDDPFGWYLHAWSARLESSLARLFGELDASSGALRSRGPGVERDELGQLYQALLPGRVRRDLGEFYTPAWLAEHTLDLTGWDGDVRRRLIDPSCGSGAFLVAVIRRARLRQSEHRGHRAPGSDAFLRRLLSNVVGFDLNPLAVLTSRARFLLAIRDCLRPGLRIRLPVRCRDALLAAADPGDVPADYLVGNPPWVNWDALPEAYRAATATLWDRYGLRPERGQLDKMRSAKKDLSMLFVHACSHRYLRDGGVLGLVITQSVFKTHGAGDGFRRFEYGSRDGGRVNLAPLAVADLSRLRPFASAANRTAVLVCRKGSRAIRFPVPYSVWVPKAGAPLRPATDAPLAEVRRGVRVLAWAAAPVSATGPSSPWITAPASCLGVLRAVNGPSAYRAHEGVNTGGLNGAYWVRVREVLDGGLLRIENLWDAGKNRVRRVEALVEPDVVFPLLRGRDVGRWRVAASCCIVAPQDREREREGMAEAEVRRDLPRTFGYLEAFRAELEARADRRFYPRGSAFYTVRNLTSCARARWKVVWPEVGRTVRAAVCGPATGGPGGNPTLADHTLVTVACRGEDEAHFVCGLLNSAPAQALLLAYLAGHPSPHVLDHVAVPRFDAREKAHRRIASLSRACHRAEGAGDAVALAAPEDELDRASAGLWGVRASLGSLRELVRVSGGRG
jgi:hypothetical protein